MTFAPNHKHTESVSSMQAREYIPSDTSKSAKSACIVRRIPWEKEIKNTRSSSKSVHQRNFHIKKMKHRAHYNLCVSDSSSEARTMFRDTTCSVVTIKHDFKTLI